MQHLAPLGVLLGFTIHRDEIARTLCINRKKAGSCCKGNCYLVKTLKKESRNEKKQGINEKHETVWKISEKSVLIKRPGNRTIFKKSHSTYFSPEQAPPLCPPPCYS